MFDLFRDLDRTLPKKEEKEKILAQVAKIFICCLIIYCTVSVVGSFNLT